MKLITIFFYSILIGCSSATSTEEFKFLGVTTFSSKSWKDGGEELRALMIYDFLNNNHPYNTMTAEFVEDNLGNSEVYTVSDHIIAYAVKQGRDRYLISFIPETAHLTSEIKDVVIDKYPTL
ncbi:hypothetical protein [Alkalimarinus sediminis]|uniref:Uncharacterized protein n=1 Tax=Alkalimarinus sediminis TaxID=1632866 RepID=A0A9E8KRP5_9ALTE|nr:hypothetical protein [Alkalimarinus sediminis]UZW76342.1 hypothetical protein NNL22_07085 [Alkalimarinus sediminis]